MLGNIGPVMGVLIILAALLLFGPKKLPELGRAIGRTLNEFKKGTKEIMSDDTEEGYEKVQRSEGKAEDKNEENKNNNQRLPD